MNKRLIKYILETDVFNAAEALFAFCGDLTSRDEPTVMSAHDDAGNVADKIRDFIDDYELEPVRDEWEQEDYRLSCTRNFEGIILNNKKLINFLLEDVMGRQTDSWWVDPLDNWHHLIDNDDGENTHDEYAKIHGDNEDLMDFIKKGWIRIAQFTDGIIIEIWDKKDLPRVRKVIEDEFDWSDQIDIEWWKPIRRIITIKGEDGYLLENSNLIDDTFSQILQDVVKGQPIVAESNLKVKPISSMEKVNIKSLLSKPRIKRKNRTITTDDFETILKGERNGH